MPSEISSRIELKLLFNAWQTDTARFYKMMCNEFKAWENLRVEALTGSTGDLAPLTLDTQAQVATSDMTLSMAMTIDSPSMPPTLTPLATNITNTVSDGNGSVVFVTKKPCKVRKDKKTKRMKPTSPETIIT
ncbi:hypothetical protein C0992_005399, partial [Termitomyces sp. T32_za158]